MRMGITKYHQTLAFSCRRSTLRRGIQLALNQESTAVLKDSNLKTNSPVHILAIEVCKAAGTVDVALSGQCTAEQAQAIADVLEKACELPVGTCDPPPEIPSGEDSAEWVTLGMLDTYGEEGAPAETSLDSASKLVVHALTAAVKSSERSAQTEPHPSGRNSSSDDGSSTSSRSLRGLSLRELTWWLAYMGTHPSNWAFDRAVNELNV